MATEHGSVDQDGKWRLGRPAALLLLGGWSLAAVFALATGDFLGARFLDLPLGALLAGQGALIGLLIVGVRATGAGADDPG